MLFVIGGVLAGFGLQYQPMGGGGGLIGIAGDGACLTLSNSRGVHCSFCSRVYLVFNDIL